MSGEPTSETWKGGGFFPGQIPEGLDLVIGDLGCAPHQMLGYRIGYQQVWPPTALPAAPFGIGSFKVGKAIDNLEAAPRSVKTSSPTPVRKSRRGRSKREAGLDCTGQMLTVLREDSRAAVFAGRRWEKCLKERFGKEQGFGRKTIEDQPLYRYQLRPAVVAAAKSYGKTFEADFLEHGLELWTHKPGRGDKRKDHTEKQALAGRVFLAALENATIDAERRRGGGQTGGKHGGQ